MAAPRLEDLQQKDAEKQPGERGEEHGENPAHGKTETGIPVSFLAGDRKQFHQQQDPAKQCQNEYDDIDGVRS